MAWSYRILRVAGIEIRVHATFLLLLAFLGASQFAQGGSWAETLADTGFLLALFATIVLHELGHALTARRFGISTKRIVLLPIGGVAELERMPEKPGEELLVAIAGPAVNVALAALTFGLASLLNWEMPAQTVLDINSLPLWARFASVNLLIAAFNLLPAFPMDGGRVLRALLAFTTTRTRATQIAARVGKGFALIFGWIGLFSNPLLVLIAVFVWFGAGAEAQATVTHDALAGIRVSDVMISEFHVVSADDPLALAVGHVLDGFQAEFLVFDGDELVGILGRDELLAGLAQFGDTAPIGTVMRREFAAVAADEDMQAVALRLNGQSGRSMPVFANHGANRGKVLGMLTLDNLGDYLVMSRAMALGGRNNSRMLIADRALTRKSAPIRTELG
jgi:Zn-dependent protease